MTTPTTPAPVSDAECRRIIELGERTGNEKESTHWQDCWLVHPVCAAQHAAALASQLLQARKALAQCAAWFQEYADSHAAKGSVDKAARNQDRANFARSTCPTPAATEPFTGQTGPVYTEPNFVDLSDPKERAALVQRAQAATEREE